MLTITTTVSQPPPVAMCGNTCAVLDTNDALGAGLPDFNNTDAVLYRPKVGLGDAATGLYQFPYCPNATAAKTNTKPIGKVALLINPGVWLESPAPHTGLARAPVSRPDLLSTSCVSAAAVR